MTSTNTWLMSRSGSSGVVLSLEGAGYLCFSFPGFSLCASAPLHAPHTRGLSEVKGKQREQCYKPSS